jgi:TnpA family transposase
MAASRARSSTAISDQYGYFSILPISATESEASYVLDGLFDHEIALDIQEHFTDTRGASDHVFGHFALTGRRFAPRLRNLKDRKLHTFEKRAPILRSTNILACRSTPA